MFTAIVYAWFPDGRIERISPEKGLYYQTCVHPFGLSAVFFGGTSGFPRIWKRDLNTGELLALTPADSGARHPVFSWEGERIAFASDREFSLHETLTETNPSTRNVPPEICFNIFTADGEGKNPKQITRGNFQDHRPCFSPDGSTIAFASNRSGDIQLWTVPADGSAPPKRVLKEGWGYRPWFSADGGEIFFYTEIGGNHRICRIPAEGGTPVPLANDDKGRYSHGPFVCPHGKTLLMHSTRSGDWGIWELPLNGDEPRKLVPEGFNRASHPTRSINGILTFDVVTLHKS